MILPDLSNSMFVARLRYIQTIHEAAERRNPDTFVRHFLPILVRLRAAWLGRAALSKLRADPFYYYLVARTKYYDQVLNDAVSDGVQQIVGVGCGSDTRAYRFKQLLTSKGVRVLECDQPAAIRAKQHLTRRWQRLAHVDYLAIDLNDEVWPELEQWLERHARSKTLVLMEGVSPYVNANAFSRFLTLLSTRLVPGSPVAYDFKISGVKDDFGRGGRIQEPFRLPENREQVATFHQAHGLRLEHMELSSELASRLLSGQGEAAFPLFREDGLVRLQVVGK